MIDISTTQGTHDLSRARARGPGGMDEEEEEEKEKEISAASERIGEEASGRKGGAWERQEGEALLIEDEREGSKYICLNLV